MHFWDLATLATLIAVLRRVVSVSFFVSEAPDRRGGGAVLVLAQRLRLSDRYLCWQFLVRGCWIRVAILVVHRPMG